MKKLSIFLVALGLGMACTPPTNNNNTDYMHCKLNGTLWESTPSNVGAIYVSSSGMVTFSGDNGTTMITANLAGITGVGNFPVGVGTPSAMMINTGGVAHYVNVDFGSGTFYLDEVKDAALSSHNIKGRFEGVATNASNDTIFITDGVIENF